MNKNPKFHSQLIASLLCAGGLTLLSGCGVNKYGFDSSRGPQYSSLLEPETTNPQASDSQKSAPQPVDIQPVDPDEPDSTPSPTAPAPIVTPAPSRSPAPNASPSPRKTPPVTTRNPDDEERNNREKCAYERARPSRNPIEVMAPDQVIEDLKGSHTIILGANTRTIRNLKGSYRIFSAHESTRVTLGELSSINGSVLLCGVDVTLGDSMGGSIITDGSYGTLRDSRGNLIVGGDVGSLDGTRGNTQVKGDVGQVDDARGNLEVEGDVGPVNEFRGNLNAGGSISGVTDSQGSITEGSGKKNEPKESRGNSVSLVNSGNVEKPATPSNRKK